MAVSERPARKQPSKAKAAAKKSAATTKAGQRARTTTQGPAARIGGALRAGGPAAELPTVALASIDAWLTWLERHHATSNGVWVKLAKKSSGVKSISYAEAVDGALRWGWIDGQGRSHDERFWLQKLTPRRARSVWSKINREKALALIERGEMQPPGLAEVERAQRDGRWQSAYDSPKTAQVPADLADALARDAAACKHFGELNAANRYAILWRLQTAKRPETRARRLEKLVAMLARGEELHPSARQAARVVKAGPA